MAGGGGSGQEKMKGGGAGPSSGRKAAAGDGSARRGASAVLREERDRVPVRRGDGEVAQGVVVVEGAGRDAAGDDAVTMRGQAVGAAVDPEVEADAGRGAGAFVVGGAAEPDPSDAAAEARARQASHRVRGLGPAALEAE